MGFFFDETHAFKVKACCSATVKPPHRRHPSYPIVMSSSGCRPWSSQVVAEASVVTNGRSVETQSDRGMRRRRIHLMQSAGITICGERLEHLICHSALVQRQPNLHDYIIWATKRRPRAPRIPRAMGPHVESVSRSKEVGGRPLVNARSETVATNHGCDAYRKHRCGVPATGWYEQSAARP